MRAVVAPPAARVSFAGLGPGIASQALTASLQLQLLGEPVRLAAPLALWLLPATGALLLVGLWSVARRRRALRAALGPLASRMAPGAGVARPALRMGSHALGLALLALALSRPQCGGRGELVKRQGIDLVLAVDVSQSMLARDGAPDRLGRARLEVEAILDRLAGDRVAVVLFAADATVQCPLTTDHAAVRLLLRGAGPASVARQGTSLAAALDAAAEALAAVDRTGRSRAVVLLSDGEDQEPGAAEAADRLGADGIRVFAVGIGSPEGEPLPALDARGKPAGARRDREGRPVATRLEEGPLRAVAERTGGRYLRAAGPVGLGELADELSRLERPAIEGRVAIGWEERYALLAFPGFLLLLAAAVLRERRRAAPLEVEA